MSGIVLQARQSDPVFDLLSRYPYLIGQDSLSFVPLPTSDQEGTFERVQAWYKEKEALVSLVCNDTLTDGISELLQDLDRLRSLYESKVLSTIIDKADYKAVRDCLRPELLMQTQLFPKLLVQADGDVDAINPALLDEVTKNPKYITFLDLSSLTSLTDEKLMKIVKLLPYLRTLFLDKCIFLTAGSLTALASLKNLKVVSLCAAPANLYSGLATTVPNIETIRFQEGSYLDENAFSWLALYSEIELLDLSGTAFDPSHLDNLKSVEMLRLLDCTYLPHSPTNSRKRLVQHLETLEVRSLTIKDRYFTEQDLEQILKRNDHIKAVKVIDAGISPEMIHRWKPSVSILVARREDRFGRFLPIQAASSSELHETRPTDSAYSTPNIGIVKRNVFASYDHPEQYDLEDTQSSGEEEEDDDRTSVSAENGIGEADFEEYFSNLGIDTAFSEQDTSQFD